MIGLKHKYTYPQPSLLFSELFLSGYANWTLTNGGAANGLTFAVSGAKAVWTAAHTAASNQAVADNHILTNSTFSNDVVSLIFRDEWTDATPTETQYEAGIWWDSNNRIYYGNNSADTLSFFNIKIGGVNVYSDATIPSSLDSYIMIQMNRVSKRVSCYRWVGSSWVAFANNIDTSAMGIPATDYGVFFGAGAEQNTRTGGDAGSIDFFYLYSGLTNTNPSTLTP